MKSFAEKIMMYKYAQVVVVPRRETGWSLETAHFTEKLVFARVCNQHSPFNLQEYSVGGSWYSHPRFFSEEDLRSFGNEDAVIQEVCRAFARRIQPQWVQREWMEEKE